MATGFDVQSCGGGQAPNGQDVVPYENGTFFQAPNAGNSTNGNEEAGSGHPDKHRIVALVALALVAVASLVVGLTLAASPDFYSWVVSSLEEKQKNVLVMMGATTAAAVATTAFQSISNMLVSLDGGFAVVYAAIMLEKYLFVAVTKGFFILFVPAACVLKIVHMLSGIDGLAVIAKKLLIFGFSLFIAIPCSLWISDVVENTYVTTMGASAAAVASDSDQGGSSASDSATAGESGDASTDSAVVTADKAGTNGDWIAGVANSIGSAVSGLADSAGKALTDAADEVQTQLNHLMETLALLIVTTCVIPLLVFVFFLWLIKVVLGVDLKMPDGIKGRFGTKWK